LAILKRAAALAEQLEKRDPKNVFVTESRDTIAKEIARREGQVAGR
jgi:hypothetical protein